jgi:4-hydroxybenzoate polyprenyltransferase
VLLSDGELGPRTALAFLVLHVLLYGGANAFNTYYDRDTGPIGGLAHPPPVRPGLLPWSLGLQAAGFPLALCVGPRFAFLYLVLFLLFTAYSHPAIRLKRRPWASLLAIGLGQGGIGFAAGWVSTGGAAAGARSGDAWAALWGFASAVLVVAALYPLSQIYQVAEDRSRGEETLGVVLGRAGALGITMALLVPGIGALALAAWDRLGIATSSLLVAYGIVFLVLLLLSRARLTEAGSEAAFGRVMALNYLNSSAFLMFIVLQLAFGQ